MSAVEEIRIKLESHLSELEQEIESLRTALTALDAEAAARAVQLAKPVATAPTAQGSAAAARSPRRRQPKLVRAAAVPAAELERQLAETGGASTVELARHTGADYGEVLARIRELERASGR